MNEEWIARDSDGREFRFPVSEQTLNLMHRANWLIIGYGYTAEAAVAQVLAEEQA